MAERGRGIRRWIVATWDRVAGKKMEGEFEQSLARAGQQSGKAFLREMRKAFDQRMAELKVQLAKGLIDQKTYKKLGDDAARSFNTGILRGMEEARKAGTLTNAEYLKLTRTLKRVGDEGDSVGARLKRAFVGGAIGTAVILGLRRLQGLLVESVSAAVESRESIISLETSLESVGLTYKQVGQDAERYLDSIMQTTKFQDEDARKALAQLITITGDYKKSLTLLDITADVATKRQISMADAAVVVGKASKGSAKGLQDLGIGAKDTGDLIGKLRTNLGGLAVKEGREAGGQMEILRKLMGEVKESFGEAILGSDGFSDSVSGIRQALIDLNNWIKNNSSDIRGFFNLLLDVGRGIGKAFAAGGTVHGGIARAQLDAARAQAALDPFAGIKPAGLPGDVVQQMMERSKRLLEEALKKVPPPGGGTGKGDPTDRQKQLAAELEKILTDIAVTRRQIDKGITESEAREQIRREQLLSGHVARQVATIEQLTRAYADLDAAQRGLADSLVADRAGIGTIIPQVTRPDLQLPGVKAGPTDFPEFGEDAASQAKIRAQEFTSPWVDGLKLIAEESHLVENLFSGLGQAWAEGGIAWLAKFAIAKVKQNLAAALENAAMALGFSFINPGAASKAAAAAAGHAAAAAAWGGVAAFSGGGGGADSSGGASSSAPSNLDRGGQLNQPSAEVHIYMKGPRAFSPEMERIVYGNMQTARERFGNDARFTIHHSDR